ncbi:cystathionine gamma-lyase [Pelagibacterium lacus]|uniref:Cystathionine gamma-lyase n=1 Tax=Pelagibacterium lacus TaxID=2282655 RepID=A0A369WCP3_9HYPH|nr:cystathionine gamma-lyase [Pelagibacterium lacus]RDE09881.1 cystathionine gamma-lyase [Pelagibacterium lacus]
MSTRNDDIIARMLHHRASTLDGGEPVPAPIAMASVYMLPGTIDVPHQYGRFSNPTWDALEESLSILEDAESVAFPSGMAAIASVFTAHLSAGDRVLLPSDGYWTTRAYAEKYIRPHGIEIDYCPTGEYGARDLSGFAMVYIETPSNPGLDICDIAEIAARAKSAGALVVVDNTTMTPLGQRPLDLGADIVLASDTKHVSGHSDVLSGHIASRNSALIGPIREWRKFFGAIPSPFDTWLVYRGLKTLDVRFDRMCATAETIANRLADHPKIAAIRFPGLETHPAHALARRQMTRFGSVLGLTFSDAATAERFIAESRFIVPATSFGGVHTSAERRARWGDQVAEGYVRLSIGCEPADALWSDFASVLNAL